jgi:hypothetical protein
LEYITVKTHYQSLASITQAIVNLPIPKQGGALTAHENGRLGIIALKN